MKNILISFIRNNHLESQKIDHYADLDITSVVKGNSIDRLFLLTNKDREQSINFKNWIGEKLEIEVKAVTLEKGSEKYILNKIESIIKYILLAEEGHAQFFYLPGENTLQINLWEIVNQNIYNGKIIYPGDIKPETLAGVEPSIVKKTITPSSEKKQSIPVYNDLKEKKIFTVKAPEIKTELSTLDKGLKSIKSGHNLLICGEEGTGKRSLATSILDEHNTEYYQINFRTINPLKIDEKYDEIVRIIDQKNYQSFLFLNIEILPFYIQEQFTEFKDVQIISTLNIVDETSVEQLNKKFYYLVSSSLITLHPLRSRKNELSDLIKEYIKKYNSNAVISDNALNYLKSHNWPGNLNELNSVISRACIETSSVITFEIIKQCLDNLESDINQWQNNTIDENFQLNDVIGDVAMHYIMLALEKAEGKKSKAAQMLGFSNYQTLSNWIKKYKK